MKVEEKKEKTTGQGGVRTTQQAIHLLTKSYGSWKVEKHHTSFLNKAKNQFLDNHHWEDIFSSNYMLKKQTANKKTFHMQRLFEIYRETTTQ